MKNVPFRFYGTPNLISYCRDKKWVYHLKLKDNLTLLVDGNETYLASLTKCEQRFLEHVNLTKKSVQTNIEIVHEKGHESQWIIAISAAPDYYKTMDYGIRWGIECMFSDFKSKGFSLE